MNIPIVSEVLLAPPTARSVLICAWRELRGFGSIMAVLDKHYRSLQKARFLILTNELYGFIY